ncbi:hypothetical protein [Microbacterium pumilum]|uniref:Uncharacterized protein n=1 Tax=Microbacterium pumilum TaxID=344165 RepID=A0ABP5DNX6_9MICO
MDAWAPIDWWKLEARALHGIPELRRAMAYFAPAEAWRDLSKGVASGWGCLLTVANIASFTLPLVAAIIVLAWVFRGGVAQVGLGGALAAIAALIAGIGFATDRRDTVGVDPKVGRLLGVLHVAPSSIGAVVAIIAVVQDAALGGIGVLGFIADVVVGALHFAFYRRPADSGSARWERNFARLQKALDAMAPDERARVHSDVQHALEVLGTRGLVSDETLIRAMEVPIGLLGMTLAPREDLKPGADSGDRPGH